jgi:glycosyltransferase involved in cell wall biosynthesis
VWHRRAEIFQRSIPDRALAEATAVIGFDTASWILAERCSTLGVPFILDQSIGHPDAKLPVYQRIAQQFPEWTEGIEPRRPQVRVAEQREHDAAVRVVVASSFTRRTLVDYGVEPAKIRVNPYGVDIDQFNAPRRGNSGPLRFLFVGLVDARKGVPLLCDAWRKLDRADAELWLVGAATKQTKSRLPDLPGLKFFDRVPHAEIPALMQHCDVFVFPSYFEGFGLVILEAMASGLPVITTTATAGPDILTEGEDGWVIEPGDLERLTERMACCIENPSMVREMGRMARATAERCTWTAYGDRWMQILSELCGGEELEPSRAQSRSAVREVRYNPTPSAAE